MVDILQVLEGLAYVGFIAGAIFAVLELRGISKDRRAQTTMNLYSSFVSSDMTEAYAKVMAEEFRDPADMEKRCSYASLARIAGFYEGVGYLCRKRLVDPKVAIDFLPITAVWRKMEPWVLFNRERTDPGQWMEFEYFANAAEGTDMDYLSSVKADIDAVKKRRKKA